MYPNSAADKAVFGRTVRGLVPGTQLFERFTLQKVIGRGAMGIVWLARDDQLHSLVALKVVRDSICFDLAAREDLKSEIRQSLALAHPNIVRIFDFIEDEQTAALSLEYVDGPTLSDLRIRKPSKTFDVPELAPLVAQMCDALTYAHESMRLVHRDLKPSNLMVNSRSELKVSDFGFGSIIRDATSPVGVCNSSMLPYMSPQQMLGENSSPADDIYALGAVLYEMLTGRSPFCEGDVNTRVRELMPLMIQEQRAQLGVEGAEVPKCWEQTISACLGKQAEDRPSSAAAVARRLQLAGAVSLRKPPPAAPGLATLRKYQVHLAAGAGMAVILLTLVLTRRSNSVPHQVAGAPGNPESTHHIDVLPAPAAAYAMELPRTSSSPAESQTTKPAVGQKARTASVQISVTPAGAEYTVFPGVSAGGSAPEGELMHTGIAPAVEELSAGSYTVVFRQPGWPDGRAEIHPKSGETLPLSYTFPSGNAAITSTPEGAEIFDGDRSLGHAPFTAPLSVGEHRLVARSSNFPDRAQSITIGSGATIKVAFQVRQQRSRSHPSPGPTPPQSALGRIRNTFKKMFSKPTPPPTRKR